MIELIAAAIISKPTTLELLEPKKIVEQVQVVPELTLEEKIKTNYYKCDTEKSYIRADNAECLDKPVSSVSAPVGAVRGLGGSLNGYAYPSCTGHVALKRYVPPGWGNATDWKWHAQAEGWTVSSVPVAGAIGWTYGHVVYVEAVNGDSVTISENNYDWAGSTRTITIPVDSYTYLYN